MASNQEQVNELREYIKKTKSNRYPIKGHLLHEATEYTKNLYFRMLCMVLQYTDDIVEEQTILLERLMIGCQAEYTVQDYMRQSHELGEKEYKEFVEEVLVGDLRYAFGLDTLILCHLNVCQEACKQFIAELIESCGIRQEELLYIVNICISILEQNRSKYLKTEMQRPLTIECAIGACYIKEGNNIEYSSTEQETIIAVFEQQTVNLDEYSEIQCLQSGSVGYFEFMDQDTVTLYNLVIDLKSYGLRFSDIKRVKLVNCKLIGGGIRIECLGCEEIVLINCSLSEFHSKAIYTYGCNKITIKSTTFNNCVEKYSRSEYYWKELGGVVYGGVETLLEISHSEFIGCGGRNNQYAHSSSIISNCKTSIRDSKFEDCWNYFGTNNRDPENFSRVLFSHITENRNNEITNSAALGPN